MKTKHTPKTHDYQSGLPHGTRYKVDSIKYFSDPTDMRSAELTFAHRQGPVSIATGSEVAK